jgi:hypothetical protein
MLRKEQLQPGGPTSGTAADEYELLFHNVLEFPSALPASEQPALHRRQNPLTCRPPRKARVTQTHKSQPNMTSLWKMLLTRNNSENKPQNASFVIRFGWHKCLDFAGPQPRLSPAETKTLTLLTRERQARQQSQLVTPLLEDMLKRVGAF